MIFADFSVQSILNQFKEILFLCLSLYVNDWSIRKKIVLVKQKKFYYFEWSIYKVNVIMYSALISFRERALYKCKFH